MPEDLFDQGLEDRKEWNKKFLSSGQIRRLFILSRDYYVKTEGSKIKEIYYIDDNEYIQQEPLSLLQCHPACRVTLSEGFDFMGEHYSLEEIYRNEHEVAHFENS